MLIARIYCSRMQQKWRASPVVQVFGVLAFVLGAIVVWVVARSPFPFAAKFVYAVPMVGFAVFLYLGLFLPSITLTDSELVVRNGWRTHRIALRDIVRAEAGYSGIAVQTQEGRVVRGWAVQKPNLARWMGWRTRADFIAEEIMRQVKVSAS